MDGSRKKENLAIADPDLVLGPNNRLPTRQQSPDLEHTKPSDVCALEFFQSFRALHSFPIEKTHTYEDCWN